MTNYAGIVGKNIPPISIKGVFELLAEQTGGEAELYQSFQDVTLEDFRSAIRYLVSILLRS